MSEVDRGVHSSTNWVLRNSHLNRREDISLHCFSSRLHAWPFSKLVRTQNTRHLVCLQPIKTSNRERWVQSHFVLLCCCFLNLKLILLRLLLEKKEENLLNQCSSWQDVSSQDMEFPFLEHLECCCQLPSERCLHVDTLLSRKVRFMLHKTPLNSWNTLLEWWEKDPIPPSPFRGFQGEKAHPSPLGSRMWSRYFGGHKWDMSPVAEECTGERKSACLIRRKDIYTVCFVFFLLWMSAREKNRITRRKMLQAKWSRNPGKKSALKHFSKWQIIVFFHACKHCISIEMASFCSSNR